MKREHLYRIVIRDLKNVFVDYYLTVDDAADKKYGVCLVKLIGTDYVEEFRSVHHVWDKREQAIAFINRLAEGEALPITLADIIEDCRD